MSALYIVFWLSLICIIAHWFAFPTILYILNSYLIKFPCICITKNDAYIPKVSVVVSAYNEAENIGNRIINLLELDYPLDKKELIIASDGSCDKTVKNAKKFEKYNVKILDFKENRGRALLQNDTVKKAKGEIVVFTDVETEFDKGFLWSITKYFTENVGCVVGNLVYRTNHGSISEAEGLYWRFEKKIRKLESNLGILATGTGACIGVRKNLWRDLDRVGDCDFTTPLDVILQGYKVVCASNAIAYDTPPSSIKGELKVRIRQSSKNFIGTLRRWGWKGCLKHPIVSCGLFFHKILRWFTPFFMVGVFLSNLFLYDKGLIYFIAFLGQISFYALAILGMVGELFNKRLPLASRISSFCIANVGIGLGIIIGILGKAPAAYESK